MKKLILRLSVYLFIVCVGWYGVYLIRYDARPTAQEALRTINSEQVVHNPPYDSLMITFMGIDSLGRYETLDSFFLVGTDIIVLNDYTEVRDVQNYSAYKQRMKQIYK